MFVLFHTVHFLKNTALLPNPVCLCATNTAVCLSLSLSLQFLPLVLLLHSGFSVLEHLHGDAWVAQVCLATPEVARHLPGSILHICLQSILNFVILIVRTVILLSVCIVHTTSTSCLSFLGEGSLLYCPFFHTEGFLFLFCFLPKDRGCHMLYRLWGKFVILGYINKINMYGWTFTLLYHLKL